MADPSPALWVHPVSIYEMSSLRCLVRTSSSSSSSPNKPASLPMSCLSISYQLKTAQLLSLEIPTHPKFFSPSLIFFSYLDFLFSHTATLTLLHRSQPYPTPIQFNTASSKFSECNSLPCLSIPHCPIALSRTPLAWHSGLFMTSSLLFLWSPFYLHSSPGTEFQLYQTTCASLGSAYITPLYSCSH